MYTRSELPNFDMLSIVFENRNQDYGAYQLRRQYPKYVGRALGYGFALILLFFSIPYISARLTVVTNASDVPPIVDIGPPPDIDLENPPLAPPPAPTPPPPTRSTIQYVPPIVVKDADVVDEAPPTVETILEAPSEVGNVTKQGNDDAPPSLDKNPLELALVETPKARTEEKPYELYDVHKPPGFPGGEGALLKYLATHIQYPPLARENNIQSVVVLSFVIGTDGKVQQVQIVKDIGGGCGKEAVRVVEAMPKWSPGEANGHPVSVRFMLPVRFELR